MTAVAHLAASGRRRIVTVGGPLDVAAGRGRLEGFRLGLRRARLPYKRGLAEHGDFTARSGSLAMAALLDRVPDLDAVFAASDAMAVGAIRVLRDSGRRIPDDVAVVGFDDSHGHLDSAGTDHGAPTCRAMGRRMARA